MDQKKHILKPGKHQFAPGEHARHDNDNLTDAEAEAEAEAEWYLAKYPHIAKLFIIQQEDTAGDKDDGFQKITRPKKPRNRKIEIRNQNT